MTKPYKTEEHKHYAVRGALCVQDAVRAFMSRCGQLKEIYFGGPEDEHRQVRWGMLFGKNGEATEFFNADVENNLVEFVDGALDCITVLWGTLFKTIGPDAATDCADVVNRSNLSKVNGEYGPIVWAGEPYKSKVLKPEGWQPPNIRGVLERHGWEFDAEGKVVREGTVSILRNDS